MKIQVIKCADILLVYEGTLDHDVRAQHNVEVPESLGNRALQIQREYVEMQTLLKSLGKVSGEAHA